MQYKYVITVEIILMFQPNSWKIENTRKPHFIALIYLEELVNRALSSLTISDNRKFIVFGVVKAYIRKDD